MKTLNPSTARRYLHVFPDESLNIIGMLLETRECWRKAAEQDSSRMSVVTVKEAEGIRWNDPDLAVILWGVWIAVPEERKCLLGAVYLETLGRTMTNVTSYQKDQLKRFESRIQALDFTVVQTPTMVDDAKDRGWPNPLLCPTGWDPDLLGCPDFSAQKLLSIGCYGTPYGHRGEVLPPLFKAMNGSLIEFRGLGKARKNALEAFSAVLTVLHSPGCSYPTMRLWQAAATSAAMISEPGDAWPAVPGYQYFEIPPIQFASIGETARRLKEITADKDALLAMARRAYEGLRGYTPRWCAAFLDSQTGNLTGRRQ